MYASNWKVKFMVNGVSAFGVWFLIVNRKLETGVCLV